MTTDPARDTRPALRDYLDRFDPAFIGLTGDLDDIVDVGEPLAVAVEQGEKLPSGGYEVTHSTHGDRDRRRRPGSDRAGPRAPPRPSSPTDIHQLLQKSKLTARDADVLLSIPSPGDGVWYLGPVPIRGYALCDHPRHRRRDLDRRAPLGGPRRAARRDRRPRGLGGAVRAGRRPALPRAHRRRPLLRRGRQPGRGALRLARRARHLGRDRARRARRRHRRPAQGHPAAAGRSTRWRPGVLVAQAIGRWGNWFNQELFGSPTDLPWALEIDADAPPAPATSTTTTFHPTFLYEFLWYLRGVRLRDLGRPPVPARPRPGRSRST